MIQTQIKISGKKGRGEEGNPVDQAAPVSAVGRLSKNCPTTTGLLTAPANQLHNKPRIVGQQQATGRENVLQHHRVGTLSPLSRGQSKSINNKQQQLEAKRRENIFSMFPPILFSALQQQQTLQNYIREPATIVGVVK